MHKIPVKARPHEIIEDVWLGDDLGPYQFTAAPAADLLSAYMIEDQVESSLAIARAKVAWVEHGFSDEAWAEVSEALEDPAHPLRTSHLLDAYDMLIEEVGKVPPTSPSATSPTRRRTSGGAKQKPKE